MEEENVGRSSRMIAEGRTQIAQGLSESAAMVSNPVLKVVNAVVIGIGSLASFIWIFVFLISRIGGIGGLFDWLVILPAPLYITVAASLVIVSLDQLLDHQTKRCDGGGSASDEGV